MGGLIIPQNYVASFTDDPYPILCLPHREDGRAEFSMLWHFIQCSHFSREHKCRWQHSL